MFGKRIQAGRNILIACSLALLFACQAERQTDTAAGEWLAIQTHCLSPATKTTITDNGSTSSFGFKLGDNMGFFAADIIPNLKLSCTNGATGTFEGRVLLDGSQTAAQPSITYYGYFPYSRTAGDNPHSLTGTIPTTQDAPFDGLADYMVANAVTDKYDVDDFPALSFTFGTHLFSIVKINVTNTSAAYEGEEILSVGLKSTGAPLAGQFSFDATNPAASAAMTDDPNYLFRQVTVVYPEASRPTLGTEETHSVYAVVCPGDFAAGELELEVSTTHYIFRLPTSRAVSLSRNMVEVLPSADIAAMTRRKRVRTIVLWGDSITGNSLLVAVRNQLGANWNVVRSGVAGDSAQQVASRQGGLPMYTQSTAFTLPASSEEYVYIDGIYWYYNGAYGQATHEWTYKSGYTPELNPLIINGIECEISWDTSLGKRRLRRLADGEATEIPARTPVSTYGSRAYADADAIAVYIGTNGRPADATIIDIQNRMKAHLTDPEALMFVWGFHQSTTDMPQYWTADYISAMGSAYGDYFIDQRTLGGGVNAVPLMLEMGQITDPSQVSDTDQTYIDRGDWPLSWFRKAGDVHPNDTYGAKVMAILLRRRMAQLGLL